MIFSAYPSVLAFTLPFFTATTSPEAFIPTLGPLASHLNLTRRWLRSFKFFEAFAVAYSAFVDTMISPSFEAYLDMLYGTLMGMFGLIETVTIPELIGIPGVGVFGLEASATMNFEAQKVWFSALGCSVLVGCLRLVKLYAHAPVPESEEQFGGAGDVVAAEKSKSDESDADEAGEDDRDEGRNDGKEGNDVKDELGRLREKNEARKRQRVEVKARAAKLQRKVIADALDMLIPGSVVGWVPATPGVVGVAMLFTTFLTSVDVWEKCGAQIAARKTA